VEKVPTFNVGIVHISAWRRLREENPYHFEERTYNSGDREFWTNTQLNIWDDFYNCPELMRNGVIVQPKAINKEELTMFQATKYHFVVDTVTSQLLKSMKNLNLHFPNFRANKNLN
jgi:hypothetical protein